MELRIQKAKSFHYTHSEILRAKHLFSVGWGPFQPAWRVGAHQATQRRPFLPRPVSLDPWAWVELNDKEQRFKPQLITKSLLCHTV